MGYFLESLSPKRKFLRFKAQDGFGKLCEFLADVDDSVKSKCDRIVQEGREYPGANMDLRHV